MGERELMNDAWSWYCESNRTTDRFCSLSNACSGSYDEGTAKCGESNGKVTHLYKCYLEEAISED